MFCGVAASTVGVVEAPTRFGSTGRILKQAINNLLSSKDLQNWQVFEKTLLVVVLLDLALGGNGYLIQIGGVRLRVVLYVICMAWTILRLTRIEPVRPAAPLIWISILFAAVTAFGTARGYLAGHRVEAIAAELKPLSYFPMLFFFLVTIRTREDLTLVAHILVACGMLLGMLYLILLLVAATGLVPRSSIREVLLLSDEFIFRRDPQYGEFVGFLYKGAFYICVAAVFLLFDPFRLTKVLATIALVSIAMTLTRGLCFAVVLCMIAGAVLGRRWKQVPMFVAQSALLLTVLFFAQQAEMTPPLVVPQPPPAPAAEMRINEAAPGVPPQANTDTTPQGNNEPASERPKDEPCPQNSVCQKLRSSLDAVSRPGDNVRVDDLRYIVQELDLPMAAIGRGLGAPIRGRDRIEMTYVEIFYKQGLPGLLVWLALFLYSLHLFLKLPGETKQFGLAFFLASLFVFVETASNTILTGSIGMAAVFISIASLLVLVRENAHPMRPEEWYGRWPMRFLRA